MSGSRPRVVFDAGGVLVGDAFSGLFPEIAAHLDVAEEDVRSFYHEVREDLWCGGMPEEDFWARLLERWPKLDSTYWRRRLLELSSPLPAASRLGEWAERAELWLLSNHRHEWLRPLLDEAGALPHLSRVIISSEAGAMKPDPEAFLPLCEGDGAVIFVDDKQTNLDAASQAGLDTLLADRDGRWVSALDDWLACELGEEQLPALS